MEPADTNRQEPSIWTRFFHRWLPVDDFRADRRARMRHRVVRDLLRRADMSHEQRDHELRQHTFPLVEPGAATFLWHGRADSVWMRHFLALPVQGFQYDEIAEHLWHLRLLVPDHTRFEYKIDIGRDGDGIWINDPLNPLLATDPFGANSVCQTYGYRVPEWAIPDDSVPAGRVERFYVESDVFGDWRQVGVYVPASYRKDQSYPVVVVHDGFDYAAHAALITVLDNLIHAGDLPPLIAVLTKPHHRSYEYVDDQRHAAFVIGELLPALVLQFGASEDPRQRVLMGASLGAVAALSVAKRFKNQIGGLVLKSGSFILDRRLLATRGEVFRHVADFLETLKSDDRFVSHAYVACGQYETLVTENRGVAAILRHAGVRTQFVESPDAHHWQNWRDQTRAGLMWCLQ